jgi:hypothetical protein
MATQRQLDKLFWELRKKFFARSDKMIVAHDILSDINHYRKYYILNRYEMAELFEQAVIATDGEDTFDYIYKENNGNLLPLFD